MAGEFICCTASSPSGPAATTAWHSAGSSRSSASRQMQYTPTWPPSRRTPTAPGSDRLRIGAEQRGAARSLGGTAAGQPPRPLPRGLPAGVGKDAELHVLRAVQGRDLAHQPAPSRPGHVSGPATAPRLVRTKKW
jgi:hypothetical protein